MENLKATTKQISFFTKKLHNKVKGDISIKRFIFYCLDDKPKQCKIWFDEFYVGRPYRRTYTLNFTEETKFEYNRVFEF